MDEQVTCASCGTQFLAAMVSCPACGAPQDVTQAMEVLVSGRPLLGPGGRQVWMPGRVALLVVNLALLVVFVGLTASEFVLPPAPHRGAPAPSATATATATFPVEATAASTTIVTGPTPAPTSTHAQGGAAPTAPPQTTATLPPPAAGTPTATLVLPTPTPTKNPFGG